MGNVDNLLGDWSYGTVSTAGTTPWSTPHTYDQRDTQIAMMQSQLVDLLRRLTEAERGLTSDKFNGTHDADLVLELIARGYVVHKPLPEEVGDGEEGSAAATATP